MKSAPRPGRFTPGKDPVLIVKEAGYAPRPAWTGAETRINCTSFVLLLKERLRKFLGPRNPHSKHFANRHILFTHLNFTLLLLINCVFQSESLN